MRIDILTIFPDIFETPLKHSIIKRAIDEEKLERHQREDNRVKVTKRLLGQDALVRHFRIHSF